MNLKQINAVNDEQLLHYSRQILLPEIDNAGQEKLLNSSVLIIGMGGLGSPAAMYLAAAGVGQLTVVDHDEVELSNLQRQILHQMDSIGWAKVESAAAALKRLNPECQVNTIGHKLDDSELAEQVKRVDIVLDCSDNFATRFAINRACVENKTPLVSGAAIRWEGQVAVYANSESAPCYRCLYAESGEPEDTCTNTGVLAPVVGIIGSIQAVEAIKVLTGAGQPLLGKLLIMDALTMQWRSMTLRKDPACPVCGETKA